MNKDFYQDAYNEGYEAALEELYEDEDIYQDAYNEGYEAALEELYEDEDMYQDIYNEGYEAAILTESIFNEKGYAKYVAKCKSKGKTPLPFKQWKRNNILKTVGASAAAIAAGTGVGIGINKYKKKINNNNEINNNNKINNNNNEKEKKGKGIFEKQAYDQIRNLSPIEKRRYDSMSDSEKQKYFDNLVKENKDKRRRELENMVRTKSNFNPNGEIENQENIMTTSRSYEKDHDVPGDVYINRNSQIPEEVYKKAKRLLTIDNDDHAHPEDHSKEKHHKHIIIDPKTKKKYVALIKGETNNKNVGKNGRDIKGRNITSSVLQIIPYENYNDGQTISKKHADNALKYEYSTPENGGRSRHDSHYGGNVQNYYTNLNEILNYINFLNDYEDNLYEML